MPSADCESHGQYIGHSCPNCDGVRKPAGREVRPDSLSELQTERALRRRPAAGFDVDGNRIGGVE